MNSLTYYKSTITDSFGEPSFDSRGRTLVEWFSGVMQVAARNFNNPATCLKEGDFYIKSEQVRVTW